MNREEENKLLVKLEESRDLLEKAQGLSIGVSLNLKELNHIIDSLNKAED